MLEPLRNPANRDNFRKAAVLVLIIWAAASVLFGIIYFFILGGRSPAPANIFGRLFCLSPLSLRAFTRLAQVQEPGGAGGEAGSRRGVIMLRLDQLAPTMGVESWIIMASGAFLLSLCFLVSFIAADAWMSRQPISLRSICSSVLELYESRGEITDNEKWQQELSRLRNDCAVALSTKYSPTGTR